MYVEFINDLEKVDAGKPFATIFTSSGQSNDLLAPMNGELKEINTKANDVMCALLKEHLSEGWLLWLAKVLPLSSD